MEDQKSDLCTKIIQSGNERDKIRTEIEEWDKKGSALKDDVKRKQNEKRALSSEEKTLNQSKNELGKSHIKISHFLPHKMFQGHDIAHSIPIYMQIIEI